MNIKRKLITLSAIAFIVSTGTATVFAADETLPDDADKTATKITIDESTISDTLYLPSINEIHRDAKNSGITGDWGNLIRLTQKNYASLTTPKRAFEVGKTLSDVAFITLSSGDDNAPDKASIDAAHDALSSLELPGAVKTEIQVLKEKVANGSLKGKDLRKQLDKLIAQTIAQIEEDENQAIRDSGSILLAAGYYKALYLGAMTVAGKEVPTPEQLSMFKWDTLTAHFIDYFTNKASDEYKNDETIKSFVAALQSITPSVNKKPEEITKDDVSIIAKSLMRLFE